MPQGNPERGMQAARTQALLREINERIRELSGPTVFVQFLCECPEETCLDLVPLTLDEYDAVRRVPSHFLTRPGHYDPLVERVVRNEGQYTVVELFGEAGIAAVRLDPRRSSHPV